MLGTEPLGAHLRRPLRDQRRFHAGLEPGSVLGESLITGGEGATGGHQHGRSTGVNVDLLSFFQRLDR